MNTVSVQLEHPILFVFDHKNPIVEIPEFDDDAAVSATSSALSVKALSEVDGAVQVHLGAEIPLNASKRAIIVFRGTIKVPNRRVCVVTSENQKLLELDVGRDEADVIIAVDDQSHPTNIWIGARPSSRRPAAG